MSKSGKNGKGASKGPARGYSWPPFEKGNKAAMTHGVYSSAVLAPAKQELANDLRDAMGPMYAPHLDHAVATAALALARLNRAESYLDEYGLIDEEGNLRPLTKVIGNLQAEARRSLEMLALTPREWAKLGLDLVQGESMVRRMQEDE